jgi:biopolymer transport protein ExbD
VAFLRAKEDEDIQFQMAPMIDVVFLLLIFFLIATSFLNPETHIITNLPKKELRLETEELPTQFTVVVTRKKSGKWLKYRGEYVSAKAFLNKVGRAMAGGEEAYVFVDSTDDARNQDVVEILDALTERGAKVTVVPPYEEEKH